MEFDVPKITEALSRIDARIFMTGDGFVDEVWEIINTRTGPDDYSIYTQMTQFAERILSDGTGGIGLELIKKRRAFGGFTANIGYAAARLGADAAMIGVYGKEKLDPVFEELTETCRLYSVGNPAVTHIFEFDTGKILMSHMEAVQDLCWERIANIVGMETLGTLLRDTDIIGVGYWSLLPAFDEIFDNVCANIPQDGKTRRFFFDFADFKKRDEASLNATLKRIAARNEKNPMILSVNEHEAAALFTIHGETFDNEGRPIQEKTEAVRRKIGLDELVIHAPSFAVAASSLEEPALAQAIFCEKPKRTTGAGDTFNGGYIVGCLAGLTLAERLHIANCAVGYFIRNAIFPDISCLMRHAYGFVLAHNRTF